MVGVADIASNMERAAGWAAVVVTIARDLLVGREHRRKVSVNSSATAERDTGRDDRQS
jgi:hypothetical protein